MSHNYIDNESVQDTDGSSVDTAVTPPSTLAPDLTHEDDDDNDSLLQGGIPHYPRSYTVPEAGSTYLIRSITSGDIITLLKGQVVLAPPGSFGCSHWECVETDGWLGFRNVASYGHLGRDKQWVLCCSAERHREWEWFHVRSRSEGGFGLVMTDWGRLRPVGIRVVEGEERLVMVGDGNGNADDVVVLQFVEVV